MNVLVTGAAGFVGREVVRQLAEAGHGIRALVRNPKTRAAQALVTHYAVETCAADIVQPQALTGSTQGVDAVIHLVGIISEVGDRTFENVHTQGTRNVVDAARVAPVKRFVHMSTLGARPDAVSRYHRTKWAAEEIVSQSGLPFTIFRPSIIYGPGDGFVNRFASISRYSPFLPVMGTGQCRFQPVSVQAVAQGFVAALQEPKAVGQTYDLCGPETLWLEEVLDVVLDVTRRRRAKLRIPLGLARLGAALQEWICGLFRVRPLLNRDQLLMLQEDNVGDGQPANELFGLRHGSFRDGIAAYLAGER